MRRRQFITVLGAAAASPLLRPLAARAQKPDRMRRVGVLTTLTANDSESLARLAAFLQGLQEAGWSVGRNLQIEVRWGGSDADRFRKHAAELVALAPDVVLAIGGSSLAPLLRVTRTVPIVFVQITDPVGAGFVASLARPGGNATGFTQFEADAGAKRLELLKEIAPRISRVVVLGDAGIDQPGGLEAAAPPLGVQVVALDARDAGEIERGIAAFAGAADGGLVVPPGTLGIVHRDLIITLAARHRLPAVYPYRLYVTRGGLISYGLDPIDPYWRAAGYVDRILKGEKPAGLPVRAPTKYQLVINLRTARALGLDVPAPLLAGADETIE